MSQEHNLEILDVSAKTGKNVDDAFLKVTKSLMDKKDKEDELGTTKKIGTRGKNKLFSHKKSQAWIMLLLIAKLYLTYKHFKLTNFYCKFLFR